MTTDTKFHFSPRNNRANEIQWREWGDDAFREAAEKGKPILLSLSAVWCHWCHVMDETSYSDESIITFINEHYIPVRVDNDQRPDINARYNMGGWPTTAFLTPDGEILAGATYIAPDQMKEVLPKVFVHYQDNKNDVTQKAVELRQQRASATQPTGRGELSPAVFDLALRSVSDAYDPVYGGLGEAPKFPHTDAIDLLLYAHRKTQDPDVLHMARKTLEFMCRGEVYDHEWGGFFRYATRRDWSEPHYEKMLEDNAGLLKDLLTLYCITNDQEHAGYARRTIEYIEWKLRDKEDGYFYGSQDADEEFYKLPADQRKGREEPYIDRTCYTSWNAMMISAYLQAAWTLARPDLRDEALRALDFLWSEMRDSSRGMYRFRAPDTSGEGQVLGLLGDQAHTARALLEAYEVTAEPREFDRAVELATFIRERFSDAEHGGFFDIWDEAADLGRLKERQKSIADNAVCAEVFTRLYHLTHDEAYNEIVRRTLEAFVPAFPQMGYFAAAYAKQVDIYLNPPVEVNIVGHHESAEPLHWAALSLNVPARIVQLLDPETDVQRLAALSLPGHPSPAAYVCYKMTCSAPVTEPDQLFEAVRKIAESGVIDLGRR